MKNSNLLFSFLALCAVGCDNNTPVSRSFEAVVENTKGSIEEPVLFVSEDEYQKLGENFAKSQKPIVKKITVFDEKTNHMYEILISSNLNWFNILLNDKVLLSSKDMKKDQLSKMRPVIQRVFEQIELIEKTTDDLDALYPNKPLSKITGADNGKHVIKKSRLKKRILSQKQELANLIEEELFVYVQQRKENVSGIKSFYGLLGEDNAQQIEENVASAKEFYSEISLSDTQGNRYDVFVSQDAQVFEIKLNSKPVIRSDKLSPKMLEEVAPVMQSVLLNINDIAKDEEVLESMVSERIFTRPRLEMRIEKRQQDVLKNVIDLMQMLGRDEQLLEQGVEQPLIQQKKSLPSIQEKKILQNKFELQRN